MSRQNLPDEVKSSKVDSSSQLAIIAWNMLGAKIDWTGLEIVSEILGITDIELLISQLIVIRDHG